MCEPITGLGRPASKVGQREHESSFNHHQFRAELICDCFGVPIHYDQHIIWPKVGGPPEHIAPARVPGKLRLIQKQFLSTVTTTVPGPFLLQIQASNAQSLPRWKRLDPSGSYLEDESSTSPRCEQGAQFRLIDGRLLRNGALVSVLNAQMAQPLLEAGTNGNIATTFSLVDGTLAWRNTLFPRQTAFFCMMTDSIFVYFDAAPRGCIDVALLFTPCRSSLPSSFRLVVLLKRPDSWPKILHDRVDNHI